ncbi:protein swallow [Condylostylus longicornis]|uniref:protein swallow n=1 Tax=Condylostylus longicornis TaxID=2530218 RepID=UPI00244E55D8|nr:protein swallow [Condylostylus longicornis]
MSLMDESFPYDEILEAQAKEVNYQFNFHNDGINKNELTKKKNTDPKKEKKLKRFQSVNDLHARYCSTKYKHVNSKVRQYIKEMEAGNKRQKRNKKLSRFNSFPVSTNGQLHDNFLYKSSDDYDKENNLSSTSTDGLDFTSLENFYQNYKFNFPILNRNESDNSQDHNESDNVMVNAEYLKKLNSEIKDLRSMNEYLQTNLDNKVAQVTKLKRANDAMQIDIVNLQDEIRNHQRHTLPESYILWGQGKSTQSTQTDDKITNKILKQLNAFDERHMSEAFLFNLISSNDSIMENCNVLRTPDLNRIKKSAKIDEYSENSDFGNSPLKEQNIDTNNNNQLDVNYDQKKSPSNLRLRSNSNDAKRRVNSEISIQISQPSHILSNNGSDSAIESEEEINDSTATINSMHPFISSSKISPNKKDGVSTNDTNKNKSNKNRKSKKQKKVKIFKKSFWKRFLGPCADCGDEKSDTLNNGNILYTKVNLSESTLTEENHPN